MEVARLKTVITSLCLVILGRLLLWASSRLQTGGYPLWASAGGIEGLTSCLSGHRPRSISLQPVSRRTINSGNRSVPRFAKVRNLPSGSFTSPPKEADDIDKDSNDEKRPRWVARASRGFHAEQAGGYQLGDLPATSQVERIERAEWFTRSRAQIQHGGGRTYCNHIEDRIQDA